ncbi:MAG: type II secretion system protein [Kiritimatiellae bacterium]|nr:type II secretion system protein [Kiritimatiellia bacterium]
MAARRSKGFTLIEVLAAMAVLAIIVLAMMRVYGQASDAYRRANTTAMRNSAARAALEMVVRDLECLVIDQKIAYYKEANVYGENLDTVCFVSMYGDDRTYELVHYYPIVNTSKGYTSYRLMRRSWKLSTFRKWGVDPFTKSDKEWWWYMEDVKADKEDLVIENLVRFDVWVCAPDNKNLGDETDPFFVQGPGRNLYNSTRLVSGWPCNTPPGYLDIYIQVASDDAMRRASMLFAAGASNQGQRVLYQDSNLLTARVVPIMGRAEWVYPIPY